MAGTNPNILDTGGSVTVYVVHKIEDGATASEFKVVAPEGWTLVGETAQYPVNIGSVVTGVSIAYGACEVGTIHVMTLTYDSPGNTPAGETFKILPHNTWPDYIRVVGCSSNMLDDGIGLESPITTP
jgi:hypothetical protein